MVQGGGVPSRHREGPSFRGVDPSLSSCGILPPLPMHPATHAASNTAMMSFKISPLRPRAFGERQKHARARSFGIVARPHSARQATPTVNEVE
jgi:hypothetical protein